MRERTISFIRGNRRKKNECNSLWERDGEGGRQNRLAISMTWLLCNSRMPRHFYKFFNNPLILRA